MSNDLAKLSPQKKDTLIIRAKKLNADHRQRVQHFVDSNQKLLEADATYLGAGEVTFAVFIAYGVLSFNIDFAGTPSGTLSFEGTDWSFGLGGWEGAGAAVFSLPPDQLSGNGSVTVVAGGFEANAFTLFVYDGNGVMYGNVTGVAEGVGIAGGNISGTFTWSGN
jgi:hypothetical protein